MKGHFARRRYAAALHPAMVLARLAHTRQSRPDPGLGLSHFQYLTHQKHPPPRVLQWDYAPGPMVVPGGAFLNVPPSAQVRGGSAPGRGAGEVGTHKTVKARLWPWFEPFSVRKSFNFKCAIRYAAALHPAVAMVVQDGFFSGEGEVGTDAAHITPSRPDSRLEPFQYKRF